MHSAQLNDEEMATIQVYHVEKFATKTGPRSHGFDQRIGDVVESETKTVIVEERYAGTLCHAMHRGLHRCAS
jgi:hypothetical protein